MSMAREEQYPADHDVYVVYTVNQKAQVTLRYVSCRKEQAIDVAARFAARPRPAHFTNVYRENYGTSGWGSQTELVWQALKGRVIASWAL